MNFSIFLSVIKSLFLVFLLIGYSFSYCDVVAGTTILTPKGLIPVEKINVGDYVISCENNILVVSQVTCVSLAEVDIVFNIRTNQGILQAAKNQLFYEPCENNWIKTKKLTTNNVFFNSDLMHSVCQSITISSQKKTIYKVSTQYPHNFFISDAHLLIHNFPPLVVGLGWAFGAGIKFTGITLGACFGGAVIGVKLFNQYKHNDVVFDPQVEDFSHVGSFFPDPDHNDEENRIHKDLFECIKLRADKKLRNNRFGNFYRDPATKLWWSKDRGGHGGSAFKVFKEQAKGLEWSFDADDLGNVIIGKHKGPVGLFISYKDLIVCQ